MCPGSLQKFLRELFYDSPKIIVCSNCVTIPETSERNEVIAENYLSVIGGYKGITKI